MRRNPKYEGRNAKQIQNPHGSDDPADRCKVQGAGVPRAARPPVLRAPADKQSVALRAGRCIGVHFVCISLVLSLFSASVLAAADSPSPHTSAVREIFVPFGDLSVLLEQQPRRVLLSRSQYQELLKKAKKSPQSHAPQAAIVAAADYKVAIRRQGAQLSGVLKIEVLEEGLHALPLDIGGVGLLRAQLDGRSAAMGRADGGRPVLLVEGVGHHELTLDMLAPLETTAAQQTLSFLLPRPPAAHMHLTVEGDVELKSGAEVLARRLDSAAGETRFELSPRPGDTMLVLTLNSHLQRQQQAVVARSVLVDEVTQAYERLHATISLAMLHRAVDRFRFLAPEKFEILDVASPLLSRWSVKSDNGRRVLEVQLREPTTETVVLGVTAINTSRRPGRWQLPKLEPLDVVGQVAVVGLLIEDRLSAESLQAAGLIPIDTAVLVSALPATIAHGDASSPPLKALAAYYAPQGRFDLSAQFEKPPAEMAVTTNLLFILDNRAQQVRGGFAILPKAQRQFAFDFTLPAGWHLSGITATDEKPLAFERYDTDGANLPKGTARIHVLLPQGIAVGQEYRVYFSARRAPADWLADWAKKSVDFPTFAALGAAHDEGAIAVEARDDMAVRPAAQPEELTPLDEKEKAKYGLAGVAANLAYRYARPTYKLALAVERIQPRLTARTFSFLAVKPDVLAAHYELLYTITEAGARKLAFSLPQQTPATLTVKAQGEAKVKQYVSEPAGHERRWLVTLEDARRGTVRLAVDFEQPLPMKEAKEDERSGQTPGAAAVPTAKGGQDARAPSHDGQDTRAAAKEPSPRAVLNGYTLPIVKADGVSYQSGLVAVEGNAELDVDLLKTRARRVDVGELVDAEYQPGRRLLGAFEFVGEPPAMAVDVFRRPGYALYPAIVERAQLHTYVARNGSSQTQASLQLRTKALYLELRLPASSELWSAVLDGVPIKPQREGQSVLLSLPAAGGAGHDLQFVYAEAAPLPRFGGKLNMAAPKLLLRADRQTAAAEVPLGELSWHLHLPSGYEVMRTDGTVTAEQLEAPLPGALHVAAALYRLAGGVEPFYGGAREAARATSKTADVAPAEPPSPPSEERTMLERGSPSVPRQTPAELKERVDVTRLGDASHTSNPPSPGDDGIFRTPVNSPAPSMPATQPSPVLGYGGQTPAAVQLNGGGAQTFSVDDIRREPDLGRAQQKRKSLPGGLEGVRSLKINLEQAEAAPGTVVIFRSLGVEPTLAVTLAHWPRFEVWGWGFDALGSGLALVLILIGLAMTNQPARRRCG